MTPIAASPQALLRFRPVKSTVVENGPAWVRNGPIQPETGRFSL